MFFFLNIEIPVVQNDMCHSDLGLEQQKKTFSAQSYQFTPTFNDKVSIYTTFVG